MLKWGRKHFPIYMELPIYAKASLFWYRRKAMKLENIPCNEIYDQSRRWKGRGNFVAWFILTSAAFIWHMLFFFFFFPPRKLKGVDVFHHGKVKRGCYSLRNGLFRGNSPFDKWMRKSGAENVAQKFWTDRLWTCVDLKRINLKVCFSEGKYLLHFEISSPFKVAQLGLSVSLTALEKWPLIFLFVLRSNFPFSSSKKCVGK